MSGNINGGSGATAMLVISAFLCLAVDVDFLTAAMFAPGICNGIFFLLAETLAAGLIRAAGRGTGDLNSSF